MVVNASDPRAMSADVVENRFDDVGKHPQLISHYRGGRAPKIMQPPGRHRLHFFASVCLLPAGGVNPRIERSLRLRPARIAAMLIILAARALSKDVLSGLSTIWEQSDRGFGEGNNVLAMIFCFVYREWSK